LTTSTATHGNFADQGEAAFKAGDYQGAVYAWRHALLDNAQNPTLVMMLGQALFATGNFAEAAGATQSAMSMLPKDKWGVVVQNYKDLYGRPQDYTDQLRALETAVKDKPNDPALRFLAGFHYGYLGYPQQAIDQLDKAVQFQPRDEAAKKLRDEMRAKLEVPSVSDLAPARSSVVQ
jgi:tetratricopeptide (TPR) repeat protein